MLSKLATTQNYKEKLTMRPATLDDLEAAVELFEVCSYHMIGQNEVSLSDVRMEWILPDFHLESATRVVVTPDGKPVGYVEVWDTDETPVRIWVWGRVHPEYEDRGIGSHLMKWAEERARKALSKVPKDLRVVMQSGAYKTYEPAHQLLNDFGMSPVRHFYTMAIELENLPPKPVWPSGIEVRTIKGYSELREVIWATEEAFQDHWGHVEQPFEDVYQRWLHFTRNDEDYDPSLWFLAMDGDEIAGVSLCHPQSNLDSEMGWVSTLGVRRPWRRQGIALALLQRSFIEFYRRGKARVGLGVDAKNLTGALRVYEKAGMEPIRQFTVYEKELQPGRDIMKR